LDVSTASAGIRRPLIDSAIRAVMDSPGDDVLLIIYDHEPVGLGYELELRRETRGHFDFTATRRTDGCWVAKLSQRAVPAERL
jgi:uncharacterized protein (DUF2249 family)